MCVKNPGLHAPISSPDGLAKELHSCCSYSGQPRHSMANLDVLPLSQMRQPYTNFTASRDRSTLRPIIFLSTQLYFEWWPLRGWRLRFLQTGQPRSDRFFPISNGYKTTYCLLLPRALQNDHLSGQGISLSISGLSCSLDKCMTR